MRTSWIRCILVGLLVSMRLDAQDTSHVALVFGLHGPGVLVPVSSKTAVRLDAAVSKSSSGGLDTWNESVGMSALFYLQRWDALRTFVGPRVSYSHSKFGGGPATSTTWSGQGLFGTEYTLARRFGVFGEVGLSYARTTGTRVTVTNQAIPLAPNTQWSTTSGVGLLFRF